ncbi:MAG: hypothetical protein J7L23_01670 [Candidatus Diapherotrites archaeon]|nr:hypothetical protein [Candidatus Diapherotrites archaeon]
MRKCLILVVMLIISQSALGISATKIEGFELEGIFVTKNETTIMISNDVAPVYGLSVEVIDLPKCANLTGSQVKNIKFLGKTKVSLSWNISSNGSCNLTKDNFKIVSWDDSVLLQGLHVNGQLVKNNSFLKVNTPEIHIGGYTDSANFCKQMQNKNNASFWRDINHCNTKARINNQLWFYADDEGYFASNKIRLKEGNNTFTVEVMDPGQNTNSTSFVVEYKPTPGDWIKIRATENWYYILGLLVVLFILGKAISAIRAKHKRAVGKKKEFEDMKKRRAELRKKLSELVKKEPLVGLTHEETVMKKNYEQELLALQEELLERPEFQRELSRVAGKAVKWARSGVASKEIRQRLVEMGYTQKEIAIIQRVFKEKLGNS